MILAKNTAETLGEKVVGLVKIIIRSMKDGEPNTRTLWTLKLTRIDSHAFHVAELGRPVARPHVIHGINTAASLIGHFILTTAFMTDMIPEMIDALTRQARMIGIGTGWIDGARNLAARDLAAFGIKIVVDDSTIYPHEAEQSIALRRLRKIEKMFVEGTLSRRPIEAAIDNLEDDIENRWSPETEDRIDGALQILESIFKIGG